MEIESEIFEKMQNLLFLLGKTRRGYICSVFGRGYLTGCDFTHHFSHYMLLHFVLQGFLKTKASRIFVFFKLCMKILQNQLVKYLH